MDKVKLDGVINMVRVIKRCIKGFHDLIRFSPKD